MDLERLIKLEESSRFIANKVDRMDLKLDSLLESHVFFKGKIAGMCIVISFLVGLLIEVAKAFY